MPVEKQVRVSFSCTDCGKTTSVGSDERSIKDKVREFRYLLKKRGWEIIHSADNEYDFDVRCSKCVKEHNAFLCESGDIRERINGGYYGDMRDAEKVQKFKEDALKEVGLTKHPKADKAYAYAWEEGHSAGIHEVLIYLERIAEVLKDD